MKTIAHIPQDDYNITIYSWNQKFIIKFEQGDLEQTYKVNEFDVSGEAEIREVINNTIFINQVLDRFNDMRASLIQATGW